MWWDASGAKDASDVGRRQSDVVAGHTRSCRIVCEVVRRSTYNLQAGPNTKTARALRAREVQDRAYPTRLNQKNRVGWGWVKLFCVCAVEVG